MKAEKLPQASFVFFFGFSLVFFRYSLPGRMLGLTMPDATACTPIIGRTPGPRRKHEQTNRFKGQRMTTTRIFMNTRIGHLTLLSSLIAAAPIIAADDATTQETEHAHASHAQAVPAKLVQLVRDATKQFADVNAATAAGYQPFLGCVTGPDHGAMGNHYVNSALVGDNALDASRPEVLIYEPSGGGLQLVGVEFVVIADTWLASHTSPPVLEGQSFQFISSPNRYGLPAHFELHVWAWRDNPQGAFVDWNNKVTCENK